MKKLEDPTAVNGPGEGGSLAAAAPGLPLGQQVEKALKLYFDDLGGDLPSDLYALVLAEVETPLLRVVMDRVGGNQSRAAEVLGLNRATLRKKLRKYGML